MYFSIYKGRVYQVVSEKVDVNKAFAVKHNWEEYKAHLRGDGDKPLFTWTDKQAHLRVNVDWTSIKCKNDEAKPRNIINAR